MQLPELAMTTSRDVIPCSVWNSLTASIASVSERLSISTKISLLPEATGRACHGLGVGWVSNDCDDRAVGPGKIRSGES